MLVSCKKTKNLRIAPPPPQWKKPEWDKRSRKYTEWLLEFKKFLEVQFIIYGFRDDKSDKFP